MWHLFLCVFFIASINNCGKQKAQEIEEDLVKIVEDGAELIKDIKE